MDKPRFLVGGFGRGLVLVVLTLILLLTSTLPAAAESAAEQPDKQKVLSRVAGEWIRVGTEQYKRGFYKACEQSLLRAGDYQEYLTDSERDKLDELLENTRIAILERKRILEDVQTASELAGQGQLTEAKTCLEELGDSGFLTKEERKLIARELREVVGQLNERKREVAELYNRSVKFYRVGRLEAAREGFLKVASDPNLSGLVAPKAKTAEDYLVEIDNILLRRVESLMPAGAQLVEKMPETTDVKRGLLNVVRDTEPRIQIVEPKKPFRRIKIDAAEPKAPKRVTDEASPIEVDNRRRNILRSYTRAVVNDAIAKAQNHREKGKFNKARATLKRAELTVNKNRLYLGDELYQRHIGQLRQLAEQIALEQRQRA